MTTLTYDIWKGSKFKYSTALQPPIDTLALTGFESHIIENSNFSSTERRVHVDPDTDPTLLSLSTGGYLIKSFTTSSPIYPPSKVENGGLGKILAYVYLFMHTGKILRPNLSGYVVNSTTGKTYFFNASELVTVYDISSNGMPYAGLTANYGYLSTTSQLGFGVLEMLVENFYEVTDLENNTISETPETFAVTDEIDPHSIKFLSTEFDILPPAYSLPITSWASPDVNLGTVSDNYNMTFASFSYGNINAVVSTTNTSTYRYATATFTLTDTLPESTSDFLTSMTNIPNGIYCLLSGRIPSAADAAPGSYQLILPFPSPELSTEALVRYGNEGMVSLPNTIDFYSENDTTPFWLPGTDPDTQLMKENNAIIEGLENIPFVLNQNMLYFDTRFMAPSYDDKDKSISFDMIVSSTKDCTLTIDSMTYSSGNSVTIYNITLSPYQSYHFAPRVTTIANGDSTVDLTFVFENFSVAS
jgi:hypothetical protein